MTRLALIPAALALAAMAQDSPIAMQPGQWEFTTTMTDVEIPGGPAEAVEAARSALGPPRTESYCVSPEEAANPAAWLASPRGNTSNCTFSRTTFADGRVDIAGTCTSEDQQPLEIGLAGDFTAMDVRAAITAQAGNGWMHLRGTLTGRRLGDCRPEAG